MDDQRKTILIQKDPFKETATNNYRPITCLLMTWKILTAQINEEICHSLICCTLFSEQQNGCCKGTRGTGELLFIDQHILNESKTRRKNLAMAWIDYKKYTIWSSKAGYYTISKCIKYPTKSHTLSIRPWKSGDRN